MTAGTPIQTAASDGRVLSGLEFGPSDGHPVLFIAGAATGKSMSFGGDLLHAANIRLLTMDRPGMGDSTVHSGRTLGSTADDYRAFAAGVLGRSDIEVPVVANSQGSVFALGAAVAGWVSRLVLVSPADELAHPAIHAMLPPEATRLADLALTNPAEATRILGRFTAEAMETMVLEGADNADRAIYTEPGFLATYRRSLAEGFANDGQGYVRDTLIAMRPWELPLPDLRVPVTILFGARDSGHSPDHGATLARRVRGAVREILGDAGGALLWTHSDVVLRSLRPC
ncbi:alpha/beta hydrolase [Saccharomonospora sp. NPDC006951]